MPIQKGYLGPFKFYNNTVTLWFDPQFHTYHLEFGEELVQIDGVTTVIHIIDKSKVLIPWAAKQICQKILATTPKCNCVIIGEPSIGEHAHVKWDKFEELVGIAQKKPREILEESGDIGKIAHTWIEEVIQKSIDESFGIITWQTYGDKKFPENEKASSCVRAALDWMESHNVQWISTERLVYSRKYEYAGTMDGLAKVSSCKNKDCCQTEFKEVLSLIDWKSSNGLWPDYVIQTAAYQYAYEEENKVKVTDRFILRLGKEDGKFEPWHLSSSFSKYDFEVFLNCLKLHRNYGNLKLRMDKYKRGKFYKKSANT